MEEVLLFDMVDNSSVPCELVADWFSPHSTVQIGHFILKIYPHLPCIHLHQAAYSHFAGRLLASFTLTW
jgi:hypothetical protein